MNATSPHEAERPPVQSDWFGQPRGLTILFLTEMWEQFSFYGMRALLVYYMVKQLGMAQQHASTVYGLYTAGFFFTPIIGGVISDRWLGRRLCVVLRATIMAAGHFMMVFPPLFYPALVTIACGNGLFLPSLPGQIDSLYAHDDPRRRSAYNVYYVGINIGGFLAPLVAGTLGEVYGWHWGFGAAGIGMVIGLLVYVAGGRYLPRDQSRRAGTRRVEARASRPNRRLLDRFGLLIAIAGCVVVFRGAYEQLGNTLALWADAGVNRAITSGWSIPATWFQSLNPLLVFLLTPLYVARWNRQAAGGREASSIVKMCTGAVLVAAAYLMIAVVAAWSDAHGVRAAWPWLAGFIVLMTAGELFILPVGLGLFGRLAPEGLSATTIATWFAAGFFGNLLAGWLGGYWSMIPHGPFFALVAAVSLVAALLLLAFARPTRQVERTV